MSEVAPPPKNEIFISYKRTSESFVRELNCALKTHGLSTWVDWEDIPISTKFLIKIRNGIDAATIFIAVIVPEYFLDSEICNAELAYAVQLDKKIVAIMLQDLSPEQKTDLKKIYWESREELNLGTISVGKNYQALSDINYIRFKPEFLQKSHSDTELVEEILPQILTTVSTDYEYQERHTKYHVRALVWEQNKKSNDLILRGEELTEAETWLAQRVSHSKPTKLQEEYIQKSRAVQDQEIQKQLTLTQRARNRLYYLASVLTIAVFLISIAAYVANTQRVLANDRELARATQQSIAEDESEARNHQLQTLVTLDNSLSIPVGHNPSDPLLYDLDIWVSNRADDTVMRFAGGDGKLLATFDVGEDPLPPMAGGGYLWVASVREQTVTRIDPRDNTIKGVGTLASVPQVLLPTPDYIWVITRTEIVQINSELGVIAKTLPLSGEVSAAIYGEPYVWLLSDDTLIRLDAVTGAQQTLSLAPNLQTPQLIGESLWVNNDAQVWRINPSSLTVMEETLVGEGFSLPKFMGEAVWVVSSSPEKAQVFVLDSRSGTLKDQWDLGQVGVSHFMVLGERLWIISHGGRLLSYDPSTHRLLSEETLPEESNLTEAVWDGSNLWFSNQRTRQILVVHGQTGKIIRRLTNCNNPSRPTYDGANMWLSCRSDDPPLLVRIPAYLYYHGLGSERELVDAQSSILPEAPQFDGKRLWVVQAPDGVVVIFDVLQECVVGTLPVGTYPSPPYLDHDQQRYWISQEQIEGQSIAHFMNYYDLAQGRLESCNRDAIPAQASYPLAAEPGTLTAIEGRLWVNLVVAPYTSETEVLPNNLDLFDLSTGEHLKSLRYGQYVNGITPNDEQTIWLSSAEPTTNSLYLVDSQTGQEAAQFPIPHFPWEPIVLGDDLWLSGSFEGGLLNAGQNFFEASQGALYRFDRTSGDQEFMTLFEGFISPAQLMGPYLWMLRTVQMPPVGNYYVRSADQLIAFDPISETVFEIYSPCKNILAPYYDADLKRVWVYCVGYDHDLGAVWVIDAQTGAVIRQYDDLGRDALMPVQAGGLIWLVYRESEYVIVFDALTTDIRAVLGLGNSPTPPVMDAQGQVWIANIGSATLQRIVLSENNTP